MSCLCSLLSTLRYQSLKASGTSPFSREGARHSGGRTIFMSNGSEQRSCIIPIRFHRCRHLGIVPWDPTGWLSCTISVSLALRSRGQIATETPTSSYVPHSSGPCGRALALKTLHTEVAYSVSGKTLKRRKTASRCPKRTSCRPSRSVEGVLVSQCSFQEGSKSCHKSLFSAAFSHTTGWEGCRICINVSCIFLSGVCTVQPGTAVPAMSPKVPYS